MTLRSAVLNIISLFVFLGIVHLQSGAQWVNPFTPLNNDMSQDQSDRRKYKFIEAARGIEEGIQASYQAYESSDGVMIFTRTEFFRSTAEMQARFETKVKTFLEIIDHTDATAVKGRMKEERVVGKNFPDGDGRKQYSIIWNHGNEISYIESSSLDHILDFEKKFYKSQK